MGRGRIVADDFAMSSKSKNRAGRRIIQISIAVDRSQNKSAVRGLTASCGATFRARDFISTSAISPEITAAATTRVLVTSTATAAAAARWLVAEEAVLASFGRPGFIYRQRAIIKRESIESANSAIRFLL
jgi:hypothetical protein